MKKIIMLVLVILTVGAVAAMAELIPMNLGGVETNGDRTGYGNYLSNCWPPIGPGLVVAEGEEQEFVHLVTGLSCDVGIQVASAAMAYWAPDLGLHTFDLQPIIRNAVDVGGCLVPGEIVATGITWNYVDFDLQGNVYYSDLPFDTHCLEVDLDYFIGWRVANYGLQIEMQMGDCWTAACESYASDGAGGWSDIPVDLGYNAQAYMWIEYSCCEEPVANAESTWGTIKMLY